MGVSREKENSLPTCNCLLLTAAKPALAGSLPAAACQSVAEQWRSVQVCCRYTCDFIHNNLVPPSRGPAAVLLSLGAQSTSTANLKLEKRHSAGKLGVLTFWCVLFYPATALHPGTSTRPVPVLCASLGMHMQQGQGAACWGS